MITCLTEERADFKMLESTTGMATFKSLEVRFFPDLKFISVFLSFTYKTIKEDMQDAYAKGGNWGYHWTYNKSIMLFPIDHILASKEFEITDCTVHREMKESDHYPMSCVLQIK